MVTPHKQNYGLILITIVNKSDIGAGKCVYGGKVRGGEGGEQRMIRLKYIYWGAMRQSIEFLKVSPFVSDR